MCKKAGVNNFQMKNLQKGLTGTLFCPLMVCFLRESSLSTETGTLPTAAAAPNLRSRPVPKAKLASVAVHQNMPRRKPLDAIKPDWEPEAYVASAPGLASRNRSGSKWNPDFQQAITAH